MSCCILLRYIDKNTQSAYVSSVWNIRMSQPNNRVWIIPVFLQKICILTECMLTALERSLGSEKGGAGHGIVRF